MGAFELLSEEILTVLTELDIEEETKPQEDAIPFIMDGENVLVIAPTGIGKTEAAILPIIDSIINSEGKGFRVLYITPLRALNRDMVRRMQEFAEKLNFTVGVRHGDTTRKERTKQSLHPPDILITTPETLQIMFTGSRLRESLKNVEYVVVDELNELAVDERGSQLSLALERLMLLKRGKEFQRIGLSATVGSPQKVLNFLVGMNREGKIVQVSGQRKMELVVEKPEEKKEDEEVAEQMKCDLKRASNIRRCRELIDEHKSTLFFVNTRDFAEIIGSSLHLWDEDFPIGVHHGSLSKEARIDVEERFKSGELKGLICTSSMELGIDVGATDLVIQYQSPRQVIRYVQRVGRSGHSIGRTSKGYIIATSGDDIAEAAVISRRAGERELELTDIPEKPLSVLANQTISHVHSERKVGLKEFYEVVKRSYSFRNIDYREYMEVIEQLAEIRAIWLDGDEIGKRRASLRYFYENISMIPDEKTFLLRDISTQRIVGTLDESFVASSVELGAVIVLQGRTWQIVDIEEEQVLASPVGDIGKIPDWTGEDIPVPYKVAQEVGALREAGWKGKHEYHVEKGAKRGFEDFIDEQQGYPLPTDRRVVVEMHNDVAVVNACFGTKINETLGRLIGSLLSARLGESVALHVDPYRIMLKLPRGVPPEWFEKILLDTDPEILESLLKKSVANSSSFRWIFLHVAKKFGAVKKEIDYRSISLKRLLDVFKDTPLYYEAMDKMFRDHMDIPGADNIIKDMQSGAIELIVSKKGLSPIGEAGLESYKEFFSPDRVSRAILMAFKERLENEKILMKCLRCGTGRRRRVRDVKKPECSKCGSFMVAPLLFYQDESIVDKKSEFLTDDELKNLRNYYKLADLARVYRHKALLAISSRGVGHDKAARILGRFRDEEELLRALMEAEISYARTKRFWD